MDTARERETKHGERNGEIPPREKKSGASLHVRPDKETHRGTSKRYISSDVAESRPTKRDSGSQHLRAKSVGEAAADIGEHAPDFRPYPLAIDRTDKILRFRAREMVAREEAENGTKDD